jgi:hypothetical protein
VSFGIDDKSYASYYTRGSFFLVAKIDSNLISLKQ